MFPPLTAEEIREYLSSATFPRLRWECLQALLGRRMEAITAHPMTSPEIAAALFANFPLVDLDVVQREVTTHMLINDTRPDAQGRWIRN